AAVAAHGPRVRLAIALHDHDRLGESRPVMGGYRAAHTAGRPMAALDFGGDHRGQVTACAYLQPALERAARVRRERVLEEQVTRAGADVTQVGGVQRDA